MTDILPRDILLYAGGDAWKRFGTFTRRTTRIGRNGESQAEVFSRADAATCAGYFGYDGLWHTAAAGIIRPHWIDTNGDGVLDTLTSLHEPGATNVCLRNRDLTNVSWTKTSCTAALNQTGVDGIANSASSLTASGANATCLQAITLASSQRFQSAWVKRITGSGTIQMTTDGGATWTTIVVTAAWTRLSIPAQTVTNPSVGFKIVTNGDAIAVDLVQNETGAAMTAELVTGASAVTRAADACTVAIPADVLPITFYAKFQERGAIQITAGTSRILEVGRSGVNPRAILFANGGKYAMSIVDATGNVFSVSAVAAPSYGDIVELVGSYDGIGTVSLTQGVNGVSSSPVTNGAATRITGVWGTSVLGIMSDPIGGSNAPGALIRAVLASGVHTLAEFQAVP